MANYGSLSDALDYFTNQRLNSQIWFDASDVDKQVALNQATRKIDSLAYRFLKTDPLQSNEFPRGGSTLVPQQVVWAAYEIAFALLDGVDPEIEQKTLRVQSHTIAGVNTTYDPSAHQEAAIHGVPSYEAWNLLRPFLADTRSVKMRKV